MADTVMVSGIGDNAVAVLSTVSIISMLTLRLAASYLLVYGLGLSWLEVWLVMHMDWVARGVCFLWRFHNNKWLEKKVI